MEDQQKTKQGFIFALLESLDGYLFTKKQNKTYTTPFLESCVPQYVRTAVDYTEANELFKTHPAWQEFKQFLRFYDYEFESFVYSKTTPRFIKSVVERHWTFFANVPFFDVYQIDYLIQHKKKYEGIVASIKFQVPTQITLYDKNGKVLDIIPYQIELEPWKRYQG